ncbi:hypothetical protein CLAIMM_14072, partial [Cladophialophora immunda]
MEIGAITRGCFSRRENSNLPGLKMDMCMHCSSPGHKDFDTGSVPGLHSLMAIAIFHSAVPPRRLDHQQTGDPKRAEKAKTKSKARVLNPRADRKIRGTDR